MPGDIIGVAGLLKGVVLEKTDDTVTILFPWYRLFDEMIIKQTIYYRDIVKIINRHTPEYKQNIPFLFLSYSMSTLGIHENFGYDTIKTTKGTHNIEIQYGIRNITISDFRQYCKILTYVPSDTRTNLSIFMNDIYVKEKEKLSR